MGPIVILGLAGAGYLLLRKPEEKRTAGTVNKIAAGAAVYRRSGTAGALAPRNPLFVKPPKGTDTAGEQGYPKEVTDKVYAEMKAEWNTYSTEKKTEICNKLKSDPNAQGVMVVQDLKCPPDWDDVGKVISYAAGNQAGGAIGGYFAQKIFGDKVASWAEDAWDALGDLGSDFKDAVAGLNPF